MGRCLLITGTGTGVGKSALSLAVLLWARAKGLDAAYIKPVQCGEFPFGFPPILAGDAEWIAALSPDPIDARVTYRFPSPVSPHLAAERAGATILTERIAADIEKLSGDRDLVVLEGAGGAAVPLDRQGNSLAMLAAELEIPSLVACAPGLGTLHHTLATLAYLGALNAPVAGFAFCHRDAAVPEMFTDNRRTLEALTGLPCFGALPHLAALANGGPLSRSQADALSGPITVSLDSWWNATPE